jgi:hypothetical protein
MKHNIQLANRDLTLAEFEELLEARVRRGMAGDGHTERLRNEQTVQANPGTHAPGRPSTIGRAVSQPCIRHCPPPSSPSTLPFGGDTEGEEILPGKQSSPSLILIDVRPRFNWSEFRKGFYVSGLFIALASLACFLILSPFVRWCESLWMGGMP